MKGSFLIEYESDLFMSINVRADFLKYFSFVYPIMQEIYTDKCDTLDFLFYCFNIYANSWNDSKRYGFIDCLVNIRFNLSFIL